MKDVTNILKSVQASATFWGATIVQCTGKRNTVQVEFSNVSDTDNIRKAFRACGMITKQDGCVLLIRYPSTSERNRMQ